MADGYTLNDDGTAIFEFEGITRVLKRPTLGQYRDAVEKLGTIRDDAREELSEDKSIKEQAVIRVQVGVVVEWYDYVFTALAGEGLPRKRVEDEDVVDEEKLPTWLLSNDVLTELLQHWQAVPSRRGGR